jgi:hypothetical protein
MRKRLLPLALLCATLCAGARAVTPPLLAKAFQQWSEGAGDLAFTQRTRIFLDDGSVKVERVERYDPSLPDRQRWRLIAIDGQAATDEQRRKWETRKNGKQRKQVSKTLSDYLDIEHAVLVRQSPARARFEVGVRPATARLLAVEKIAVVVTVEREHDTISHIAATLREPIRVLLGLARITDFDLDVGIDPPRSGPESAPASGDVHTGSSARVMMSKFGDPTEYRWSDFKRVTSFAVARNAKLPAAVPP